MKVSASAGSVKNDLRDYCHNIRLVAQTEEEAQWLAMLYRVASGQTDGIPCFPGNHRWVTKIVSTPDQCEVCTHCQDCGWEYQGHESR